MVTIIVSFIYNCVYGLFCATYVFSQLIQGLIDGEEEFVKEMKTLQLRYLDSSRHVSVNILNQKEMIFRNIKDIVCLHER